MKLDITKVTGDYKSIEKLDINIKAGIIDAWKDISKDLKAEFKRQVDEKKTGRIYTRKRKKRTASAPGETPASRTGKYKRSVGTTYSADEFVFGNKVKHAAFLENGTRRMKSRPGLLNTISAREGYILKTMGNKIYRKI